MVIFKDHVYSMTMVGIKGYFDVGKGLRRSLVDIHANSMEIRKNGHYRCLD